MYLVDSSVWINHFRRKDVALSSALDSGLVITHPYIVGELALGSLHEREKTINLLRDLPTARVAEDDEVLLMIDSRELYSRGIGYIDAHLIASTIMSGRLKLWTADKRLNEASVELGIAGSLVN